ncbi:hypothetical protein HK405_014468 [Cladochytrium tenue]|nr:hypothetical protein HK405_014468 [Cladochytrium tenue]
MRVCVPAVSYFEYHPLSIVRAGADSVTFLYPAAEAGSRQWMSRVAAHIDAAVSKEGKGAARVHLQGPFGGPNRLFAEAAGLGALALFVGGTGAAPALAVVRGLLDACRSDSGSSGRNGDAEPGFLVSDSAGAVAATTVKKGVSPRHRIFLFWSVPAAGLEHLSVLRELVADAEQLGGSVQLMVELFDSSVPGVGVGLANGEDSKLETVAVHGGGDVEEIQAVAGAGDFQPVTVRTHRARPHLRGLLNHHAVPVLKAENGGRGKLGVFICGPERFTEDGLLSVRTFQSENKQVDVVLEVESYAL